jgi:hypothetical protein
MQALHPGCKTEEEREWSNLLQLIKLSYQISSHLDKVHGRTVIEWQPFNVPSPEDIERGRRMGARLMSTTEVM